MPAAAAPTHDGPQPDDGPTHRPLAEPLHLAAAELGELARLSDRLQDLIARLTETSGPLDLETLTEAQAADLLSQRLTGLAAFLRAIAWAAPAGATTDVHAAVMELTLTEQARRLGGGRPAAACNPVDSGEFQLFGD